MDRALPEAAELWPTRGSRILRNIGRLISLLTVLISSWTAHAGAVDVLDAAIAARLRSDFDTAIRMYSLAIESRELPKDTVAAVLASRGVAYDAKGEVDKAIADFDRAIEEKPNFGNAYIYRGLAWVRKRDYDHAIADFSDAIVRDSDVAYLAANDRGNVYELRGRLDVAFDDYNKAIQLNPTYAPAYYNRARIHQMRRDYGPALQDYGEAIRLQPDYSEAYYNRGVLHRMMGAVENANADFEAARRLEPNGSRRD